MSKLADILKTADRLNPQSTMSSDWYLSVERNVSHARATRKLFHVVMSVSLVLITLFGTTNLYAQGVEVDHPLYPMKQFGERVIILVAPPSQKNFVYRHLIDRRIEEVKKKPSHASLVAGEFSDLLEEQERLISEETQAQALSDTVAQTTMFERDIERLRNIQEAQRLALALTLHHERLLNELHGLSQNSANTTRFQPTHTMNFTFAFPENLGTNTPKDILDLLESLESIQKDYVSKGFVSTEQLLQALKTKNSVYLELLSESR